MKKIIRLTESDLTRIVRRIVKENEEEWISQSEDMEMDSDFSKMEKLKQSDDFQGLVKFFKENPDKAEEIQRALEMNINESYKYYDYGDNKKEITRNHFLKRKLMTYGIASLVSGVLGYMMGTMANDEILQAALLMAGMGGAVWGTLASEVGREKVKDNEEPIEEGFFGGKKSNYRIMRGGPGYIIGTDKDDNAGDVLSIKCRQDVESIDRLIEDLERLKGELTSEDEF